MSKTNKSIIKEAGELIQDFSPAIMAAFTANSPAALQTVLVGLGFSIINAGVRRLKDEEKDVDFKEVDVDLVLSLAKKGAGKKKYIRELWVSAVRNAMDPDYLYEIRHEDIDLLEKLNTSDMVLLYMVGRYQEQMNKDMLGEIDMHYLQDSRVKPFKENGFKIDTLYRYFNLRFDQEMKISKEALYYALRQKTDENYKPQSDSLFSSYSYIETREIVNVRGFESIGDDCFPEDIVGLMRVFLNATGQRLLQIISDPKVDNIIA
jgi:hypothetical protein